ncbi:UDP-glucose-4-epimerase GalE [Gulbenkiania indica]|uniref:UDP-glucose 4-epimerase n=1 Tax=Gulbenkiania indica TaxID=375574 RepID=A0A0K6H6L2_9NEIS|nr:UDP-glucose 4-epimerase GalE [Gulbenkiania indica]CUA86610.1 UDP-glucose-4-epimerase GalE [Gulbenkiania indica]
MKKILVTGAAGYIGSHTTLTLLKAGYDVVAVDNFCNSKPASLERVARLAGREAELHRADIRDRTAMDAILAAHDVDAVIHFAALKAVGESVEKPLLYYENNVAGTLVLLEAMRAAGVRRLVFSSSATVYGLTDRLPITEDTPLAPTNPYGRSKRMMEDILTDVAASEPGWQVALLRYFNPVGAHESGQIGEDPNGIPNNLMPFISQVAVGQRPELQVFGNDYPTPDGTGVRDYIHVMDLAEAHVAALAALPDNGALPLNLGTGRGYSVLELVETFSRVSGRQVPYRIAPRRPGDVAACYADPAAAEARLGWKAQSDLETMCADTWRWQSQNPEGYPA